MPLAAARRRSAKGISDSTARPARPTFQGPTGQPCSPSIAFPPACRRVSGWTGGQDIAEEFEDQRILRLHPFHDVEEILPHPPAAIDHRVRQQCGPEGLQLVPPFIDAHLDQWEK